LEEGEVELEAERYKPVFRKFRADPTQQTTASRKSARDRHTNNTIASNTSEPTIKDAGWLFGDDRV